ANGFRRRKHREENYLRVRLVQMQRPYFNIGCSVFRVGYNLMRYSSRFVWTEVLSKDCKILLLCLKNSLDHLSRLKVLFLSTSFIVPNIYFQPEQNQDRDAKMADSFESQFFTSFLLFSTSF